MFFLRKLNFKLRACNHHIKGLPFFRRPLVCCVCARAVFSIRFPCFFSRSGKLTYNRPNTRCSPERSRAANCIYQKHSTGLFTLCDLIKTCSRWECVSDCVWYKGTVSAEQNRSDHMKKGPHVNSIGVICLSPSNHSWYLVRRFLPGRLARLAIWLLTLIVTFFQSNQSYKSFRSYPHWPFNISKFTQLLNPEVLFCGRPGSGKHVLFYYLLLFLFFFFNPTAGFMKTCFGFNKRGHSAHSLPTG